MVSAEVQSAASSGANQGEPLVQVINAALAIHRRLSRVHAKLKTARTGINIFAEILRQIGRRAAGFRILLRGRWQGDK